MICMPEKKRAKNRGAFVTRSSPLPGFRLSITFTLIYLTVDRIDPLRPPFFCTHRGKGFMGFLHTVTAPRVMASYRVTLGSAAVAALLSAVFGMLLAWVLARYDFPGKRVVDALVDLPFALPTAVAGISLTALYTEKDGLDATLSLMESMWPLLRSAS
jgi:sulfate/thiosulfate transport system permease protein